MQEGTAVKALRGASMGSGARGALKYTPARA